MTYKLATNWVDLVDKVRSEELVSPTTASWKNGRKHGLHESSVSRDIVSFLSRRINQEATMNEIISGLPTAFQETQSKTTHGSCIEYTRELLKMGIIIKTVE